MRFALSICLALFVGRQAAARAWLFQKAASASLATPNYYWDPEDNVSVDGSNNVLTWTDKIASNVATGSGWSGNKPSLETSVFGSLPGIKFERANDEIMTVGTAISGYTEFTLIFVFKPNVTDKQIAFSGPITATINESTRFEMWDRKSGSGNYSGHAQPSSPLSAGTRYLFSYRSSAAPSSSTLKINGTARNLDYSGTDGAWAFGISRIGCNNSSSSCIGGHLGPILLFNRTLTTDEETAWYDQLIAEGW
jgi:hypothetical protein